MNSVAPDTSYLNHMLRYAAAKRFGSTLSNARLKELGAKIDFYPGVPDVFGRLRDEVAADADFMRHEIRVEHYIISTGLRQMILGSKVAASIDGVWACEFVESPAPPGYLENPSSNVSPSEISQIGYMIDNTTKTRAIFEINKGSNKLPIDVNDTIAKEERRVPFQNMIDVADGPSDIPVFSILNQYGGKTFAVYNPGSPKEFAQVYNLQQQGRVQGRGPADYREESHTSKWLSHSVREIARQITQSRSQLLDTRVKKSPRHIADDRPSKSAKPAVSRKATDRKPQTDAAAEEAISEAEFLEILRACGVDVARQFAEADIKRSFDTLLLSRLRKNSSH